MTPVRLPQEMEQQLENLSRQKHKSKSDIIKEALENLFLQERSEKDSYEIGKELFAGTEVVMGPFQQATRQK